MSIPHSTTLARVNKLKKQETKQKQETDIQSDGNNMNISNTSILGLNNQLYNVLCEVLRSSFARILLVLSVFNKDTYCISQPADDRDTVYSPSVKKSVTSSQFSEGSNKNATSITMMMMHNIADLTAEKIAIKHRPNFMDPRDYMFETSRQDAMKWVGTKLSQPAGPVYIDCTQQENAVADYIRLYPSIYIPTIPGAIGMLKKWLKSLLLKIRTDATTLPAPSISRGIMERTTLMANAQIDGIPRNKNEELLDQIGKLVKAWRIQHGLTRTDLAKHLRFSNEKLLFLEMGMIQESDIQTNHIIYLGELLAGSKQSVEFAAVAQEYVEESHTTHVDSSDYPTTARRDIRVRMERTASDQICVA